jgi:predicted dehydrogenase
MRSAGISVQSSLVVVAIGLAGAGRRAAQVYAPYLASCSAARFAGIWARSPDAMGKLAANYGVPAYERFDDLLEHCGAVAFAIAPAAQAEYAPIAARRGKAVLLERPVASDLSGCEQVVEAVDASGVVSQVALVWRFASAVRRFLRTDAPQVHPVGGAGKVVSGVLAAGSGASSWRIERGVLKEHGPDLVDLLDAALGPVVGVDAHGDPRGWVGLQLEHQVGHFAEASLYATSAPGLHRADVEVFGPGGAADIDCVAAVGELTYQTMFREFAEAVEARTSPELDVHRGLHLQRVIEAAETNLITRL